jgi:hypothetical protein
VLRIARASAARCRQRVRADLPARDAEAGGEHGGRHQAWCRGRHADERDRGRTGHIGGAQHRVRLEPIHQPPDGDRSHRPADLIHRRHERGARERRARRLLNQRGHPVGQQVDDQQAHEERQPEEQRPDKDAAAEQLPHRRRLRGRGTHELRASQVRGRRDSSEQRCHTILRVILVDSHHEVSNGFGQRPGEHWCEQQRRDTTADEERAPPVMRQHVRGNEAAEAGADRETAEHQRDQRGAACGRAVFGRDGDRGRHRAAQSDAGQEAQPGQGLETAAQRRRQAGAAKQHHRGDQHRLAAVTIRQRSDGKRADHQAEEACREQRSEAGDVELPLRANRRRDEPDDRRVEAVDGHDRKAEQ